MEIQLLEGFDQVPGASDLSDTLEALGYTVVGSSTLTWGEGRHEESQSLALLQDTTNIAVSRTFDYGDSLVIGFAVNTTERAQVLSINDDELLVGWDDDGMHLRDQESTAKPIRDRWYYLELELDKIALECRLYINGTLDMTAPLPDELISATEATVTLGGVNPTNEAGQPPPSRGVVSATMRFDDWYVSDERMEPIEIRTRFPDADVTTEWNTPTGTGDHWPEVTQQPPTDARYITSYNTGDIDAFTSSTPLPADADILAVAVTARARKGDIDTRALGIRYGADEEVQTTLTLESEWYVKFFPAPDGAPWSAAAVEAETFGVAVR